MAPKADMLVFGLHKIGLIHLSMISFFMAGILACFDQILDERDALIGPFYRELDGLRVAISSGVPILQDFGSIFIEPQALCDRHEPDCRSVEHLVFVHWVALLRLSRRGRSRNRKLNAKQRRHLRLDHKSNRRYFLRSRRFHEYGNEGFLYNEKALKNLL